MIENTKTILHTMHIYLNSFNKDTEKTNEIYGTKTLTYTFVRGFFPWSFCPRPKIYNLIYSYMLSTI